MTPQGGGDYTDYEIGRAVVYMANHGGAKFAAQTFGVMLLSGRPQLFFDRIDKGDKVWRQTLRAPYGKVSYFLVASQAAGDLIRRAYGGGALSGSNPSLIPVFRTDRYVLLSVAPQPSATAVVPTAATAP